MISIHTKGLREMRQTLERILKERPRRIEKGLQKAGKKVLDASQEIVPVLTGDLSRTGRVTDVESEGEISRVSVVYGDDKVNYASYVHEVPHKDNRHKYLERPTMDYVKDFAKDMAEEVGL